MSDLTDLSPTALAELEIGSQQDHNARHAENVRRTRDTHAPLVSWPAFVVLLITALSLIAAGIVTWAFPEMPK
ncbi:hypothetical protein [Xenophilus sp. Marseille-Q4582]|uniref:hypothetical protein n=1 Tax=Xenophilus sp. Marseille-Q4582 TaxID=2866600 RepID=UPI001CE40E9A|nr:hypothetical protein [Xenophilus sp. Marseille-Q4582]